MELETYFFPRSGTLLLYLEFFEVEISITMSQHIGTPFLVQFQQKCTKKDKALETAPHKNFQLAIDVGDSRATNTA